MTTPTQVRRYQLSDSAEPYACLQLFCSPSSSAIRLTSIRVARSSALADWRTIPSPQSVISSHRASLGTKPPIRMRMWGICLGIKDEYHDVTEWSGHQYNHHGTRRFSLWMMGVVRGWRVLIIQSLWIRGLSRLGEMKPEERVNFISSKTG